MRQWKLREAVGNLKQWTDSCRSVEGQQSHQNPLPAITYTTTAIHLSFSLNCVIYTPCPSPSPCYSSPGSAVTAFPQAAFPPVAALFLAGQHQFSCYGVGMWQLYLLQWKRDLDMGHTWSKVIGLSHLYVQVLFPLHTAEAAQRQVGSDLQESPL